MKSNRLLSIFFIFFLSNLICANTLSEIKSSNEIRIGVRNAFPPFSEFKDDSFNGFEVELAKEIGKIILGPTGKVTLVGVDAKDRIPKLNDNIVDLIVANFSVTEERKKYVDVSIPYFSGNMAIVTPKKLGVKKLSDMNFKKIGYLVGTTSQEYIEDNPKDFANIETVACENSYQCFQLLKNGEIDGYFHTIFALGVFPILDDDYTISIPAIGKPDFISAAVAKDNKKLLKQVDRAILELSKDGFFKRAYDETFNTYYKGTLDRKYFLLDDIYNIFTMTNK